MSWLSLSNDQFKNLGKFPINLVEYVECILKYQRKNWTKSTWHNWLDFETTSILTDFCPHFPRVLLQSLSEDKETPQIMWQEQQRHKLTWYPFFYSHLTKTLTSSLHSRNLRQKFKATGYGTLWWPANFNYLHTISSLFKFSSGTQLNNLYLRELGPVLRHGWAKINLTLF